MVRLDNAYWDSVAKSVKGSHLERNVAEYKRQEHIMLLEKWCGDLLNESTMLKTDSYEEAFGLDSFMDWLTLKSNSVFCIDISKEILMRARERHPSTRLLNASVLKLPFRNQTFDLIISNSTLDHLAFEDVPLALKEFSRTLRSGGMLILTLDNAHNPIYRLGYFINKKIGHSAYVQERCYSKNEIVPMLKEAGFDVKEIGSIVHLPTPFNLIARITSPLNRLLCDLPVKTGIAIFSIFGLKGRNIHTGWFLALKCVKKMS
jgi:SAM-dependent methyltransferase